MLLLSESIAHEKPNMFSKAWNNCSHSSVVTESHLSVTLKMSWTLYLLFWININLMKKYWRLKAYNYPPARYTVISYDESVSGFPYQCTLPTLQGNIPQKWEFNLHVFIGPNIHSNRPRTCQAILGFQCRLRKEVDWDGWQFKLKMSAVDFKLYHLSIIKWGEKVWQGWLSVEGTQYLILISSVLGKLLI